MISIRPALHSDEPELFRICISTGASGKDATGLYRRPELLNLVYAAPYLFFEGALAFVAEDEVGVCGYVLAAVDSRDFEAWAESSWWPELRRRHPEVSTGEPDARLIELIQRPALAPETIYQSFPSHLHIDLLERAQGRGIGRRLMDVLLEHLKNRGSRGVHLGVGADNPNAIAFYEHLGFRTLQTEPWGRFMGLSLQG